ncbi:Phosphoribosylanthranilate isomerase [Parvibaculum lavamentivorans DS-1]|uniref:N-(5'-phosphoribosyl)anthranilate isomerase n=1 Tax=Parvibaculum lavamentivorans (strain DS-1 / DSM 13023 / NCIMB 13966) TaxID=402881 RepID=TRPF_PARL1|nr:phosphoribosylanthranilate isomerase [Parvibaculum lavamentivorans]A7HPD4.1 RecName: Full=N-(5'-phosphoribosyl)anthranilate isomerase; Short=PRAI [Parvibaculum lavamentivorans DS-1]ABS61767.1 Phosphoribosylanthranilate isomerase [Parvibaculum lavamentivorans DS-1]
MSVQVKICGLSTPETIEASVSAGADYLGFVFFSRSPRHLSYELAARLSGYVPASVPKVALTVDADDAMLDAVVEALRPDILQLHGDETPQRLVEIKARYGLTLMKAICVAQPEDPLTAAIYRDSADLLLFDAKPPKSMAGALPGGNGLVFDWSLIAGHRPETPWMLSGGLNAENVAEAVRITGAEAVDVSSGIEEGPGRKTPELIEAFIRAAKRA